MPNFITHLAIAKVYAEKHRITDYAEFLKGSLAPDFRSQGIRHYLNHAADPQDVRKTITDRVNLSKYLTKIDVTKDFGRGVFLHMLADNYCYLNVLDIKKFQKAVNRGADYDASIYNSAMKHFAYIAKKYKIKAEDFESTGLAREMEEDEAKWALEVKQKKLVGADDLMDAMKLDKFIEEITRQPIETLIAELRSGMQEPEPESKLKPEPIKSVPETEPMSAFVPEPEPEIKPGPEPDSKHVLKTEPKSEPELNAKEPQQTSKIIIDDSFEHREIPALQESESGDALQSFQAYVMEFTAPKPQESDVQRTKEKQVKDKKEKKTKKIKQKKENKQKNVKEADENQSIAEDLVKTFQNSSMFRKPGG